MSTDLGGGVHEHSDAWAETGYEPHGHGPHQPPAPGLPRCPFCSNREGHELNTGALGGLLCGRCCSHFTSAPGEYEAMAAKRALWAEETKGEET
jgi:hypothetical protein